MMTKTTKTKKPAEQVMKDIRRATRRHFSAEDKFRIVLDGLRGIRQVATVANGPRIESDEMVVRSREGTTTFKVDPASGRRLHFLGVPTPAEN